ncbi:hypothetical protein J4217_01705 [Candidatus Pacearchaeota archaeon]|nr:hypothetical protein [Candidatus Pacearchaeota archaeon]
MNMIEKINNKTIALGFCAFGRALDLSTTWVGLERSIAEEIKPGALHIMQIMGDHKGLICYEALITTPLIFLGCKYLNNKLRSDKSKATTAENLFLYGIGAISLIVTNHNLQYLLR